MSRHDTWTNVTLLFHNDVKISDNNQNYVRERGGQGYLRHFFFPEFQAHRHISHESHTLMESLIP